MGLNPTRTAFLDVLGARRGPRLHARPSDVEAGEPVGTVVVSHGEPAASRDRPGRGARAHRRTAGARRPGDLRRRGEGDRRRPSCAPRRATASARWWPGCAPWAPTRRSCPTGSTCAALARSPGGPWTRARTTGSPWRLPSPPSGATGPTIDQRRRGGRRLLPGLLRDPRGRCVPKADKLYFVGFMGAGKSTMARALAGPGRVAARRHRRVDRTARAADDRRHLPRQHGEPYFRALEREAVRAVLPERYVAVATGRRHLRRPRQPRVPARRRHGRLARRALHDRRRAGPRGRPPPARRGPRTRSKPFTSRAARRIVTRTFVSSHGRAGRGSRRASARPTWLVSLHALSHPERHPREPRGAGGRARRRAAARTSTACWSSATSSATAPTPTPSSSASAASTRRDHPGQPRQGGVGRRVGRGLQPGRPVRGDVDAGAASPQREPRLADEPAASAPW